MTVVVGDSVVGSWPNLVDDFTRLFVHPIADRRGARQCDRPGRRLLQICCMLLLECSWWSYLYDPDTEGAYL